MASQGTRLETNEEVREALARYRPAARGAVPAQRQPAPADDSPPLFRPTQRPPMPVLTVFDDGSDKGESIRIRKESFIMGRAEGDLVIAYDVQMSGRHAEVRCTASKNKRHWQLVDLNSTNGTYVRIGHAVLEHGQEFIVGRTRFRFEHEAAQAAQRSAASQATQPWQSGAANVLAPSIVELTATLDGSRSLITQSEVWVGKDASYCQVVLRDDPFASARHARVYRDDEGRWVIENNKSLNGVWLRIQRLPLNGTCRFLLGEQQFMVRIP
jgi:pSer/pThr/pTyr-binding forkhead associated (FHA) protein